MEKATSINTSPNSRDLVLHRPASTGKLMQTLIDRGADISDPNTSGETALH